MRRLIVNADDLGLTPGCNRGIVRAMTEGVVSDTSLMINTEFAAAAVELFKKHGINRAGLHFNLTYGPPVSPPAAVPSLVDQNGRFRRKADQQAAKVEPAEVIRELRAQLDRFYATGLGLTHLDGHHHIHAYPGIIDIVAELAKGAAVPVRQTGAAVREKFMAAGIVTTNHFSLDFYDQGVNAENFKKIVLQNSEGVLEIMCHPAEVEAELFTISSYNARRGQELAILTAPALKAFLRDNDIQLISFADLD